jgi:hypothetical protein
MRTALVFSFVTFLVPSVLSASELIATPMRTKAVAYKQPAQNAPEAARRCAFIGRRGSFHLIGAKGTAAYKLGKDKYVADLEAAGEDANYWYYLPQQKGDQFTTMWAFARRPDCGRYWVWRHDRRGWGQYEATDAWGDELNGSTAGATTGSAIERLQFDVRDLQQRMRTLEQQRSATP